MTAMNPSNWTAYSRFLEPSLEEHLHRLESFSESLKKSQRLAVLLENAEKYHHLARPHIYRRVKEDYQKQKDELERRLAQERTVLIEEYQNYSQERITLHVTLEENTERLEELEFRYRVGEYSEQEIEQERTALKTQIIERAERIAWLGEIVDYYIKAGIVSDSMPGKNALQAEDQTQHPQEDRRIDEPHEPPEESHEDVEDEVVKPCTAKESPDDGGGEVTGLFTLEDRLDDGRGEVADGLASEIDTGYSENMPEFVIEEASGTEEPLWPSADRKEDADELRNPSTVSGYLTVLDGSRQGERFPLICSNITLGSSPGIDIRLNDPGVANFHARVVYRDRKYVLEKFDGLSRCYVNGIMTGSSELKDGDIIRIGNVKLRVEFGETRA